MKCNKKFYNKFCNVNQKIITTKLYYVKFSFFEEIENNIND